MFSVLERMKILDFSDVMRKNVDQRLRGEAVDEAKEAKMRSEIEEMAYVPMAEMSACPRNNNRRKFDDVDSALRHFEGKEYLFTSLFNVAPGFVRMYAMYLLPNGTSVAKKGSFGSELALLVVLCRLSSQHFDVMEHIFGVANSTLVEHFFAAINLIDSRFARLLDLTHSLRRFEPRENYYGKCIEKWSETQHPDLPLHPFFLGFRLILDGLRQDVCRPSVGALQEVMYSGYTKTHGLLYGVYVAVDGLIMAMTKAHPGRHPDTAFIPEADTVALATFGMPALADAAFQYTPGAVLPLPKRKRAPAPHHQDITPDDCAVASGARIAVEHTIGHLKARFPLAFNSNSLHVLSGDPEQLVRVSVILYNLHACEFGTETTLAFRCQPPTGVEWLTAARLQSPT